MDPLLYDESRMKVEMVGNDHKWSWAHVENVKRHFEFQNDNNSPSRQLENAYE